MRENCVKPFPAQVFQLMTDAHRERTVNKFHTSAALAIIYLLFDFSQQLGVRFILRVAARTSHSEQIHPERFDLPHFDCPIAVAHQFWFRLAICSLLLGLSLYCSEVRFTQAAGFFLALPMLGSRNASLHLAF